MQKLRGTRRRFLGAGATLASGSLMAAEKGPSVAAVDYYEKLGV